MATLEEASLEADVLVAIDEFELDDVPGEGRVLTWVGRVVSLAGVGS